MGIGETLKRLPDSTLRKAWRIAHALHETKSLEEVGEIIFTKINSIIPHETGVIYAQNLITRAPLGGSFLLKNIDGAGENIRRYNEYYFQLSPVLPTIWNPKFNNTAFSQSDVVGDRVFLNSEYYTDFFKPMGLLHTMVLNAEMAGKIVGCIALHRPPGTKSYSEKEKALMTLIAPAISSAIFTNTMKAGLYETPAPAALTLAGPNELSAREEEITGLIMRGLSNKEIGERLFISDKTVKLHVNSILRKTGAKNRVALISSIITSR